MDRVWFCILLKLLDFHIENNVKLVFLGKIIWNKLAGKLNVKIQRNNEYNETGGVEYKLLRLSRNNIFLSEFWDTFDHFKKW